LLFKTLDDSNTLHVLRCIWLMPTISRVDIAHVIGINQSTVSRIVSQLLDGGIVQAVSLGESGPRGGRKPVHLRLNPGLGCVVGVEMQSEGFMIVGINPLGEILFRRAEAHRDPDQSIVALFADALGIIREEAAGTGLPLLGIGIGLPAIIDSREGVILRSGPLEIRSPLRFVEASAPAIDAPIRIEHDARCCCFAELTFHRGRRPANFLFVRGEQRQSRHSGITMAIGMGLVIGNRVYTGERFAAGEFCSVFNDGTRGGALFSLSDAELACLNGDAGVRERFSRELGRNLALLVNVLDLPKVYMGGTIEELGEPLLACIREEVRRSWLHPDQADFAVEFTKLGREAVAYGAAGMFLEHFLSPPVTAPTTLEIITRSASQKE
jgi:predicted NBD/HSP70 family sugar kinase